VLVNGVAANVLSWNPGAIIVTVPKVVTGTSTISVIPVNAITSTSQITVLAGGSFNGGDCAIH
jgi:hypothetical protein